MTATLTYNSIQTSGGLHAPVVTTPVTVTGGAIDLSLGNYYQAAVSGDTTFTLSNVPSGNVAFTLEITYTSGVITWFNQVPYTILWSNGIAPIPTTGTITYTFILQDGDTYWKAIASEVYAPPAEPAAGPVTLNLVGKTYNTDANTISLPAGSAAGDLAIYFDHPTSSSSTTFSLANGTPTGGATGSYTSLGGTTTGAGSSSGAYMWYKVLNASDITLGYITGRSTSTSPGYRKKSVAVFRKSSGSIASATTGITNGLVDTGGDTPVAITSSAASTGSIAIALMLASNNGTFTAAMTDVVASLYSEIISINQPSFDIAASASTSAAQHGVWAIMAADETKYDITFTHTGGSNGSTVRNYIVVT